MSINSEMHWNTFFTDILSKPDLIFGFDASPNFHDQIVDETRNSPEHVLIHTT